MKKILFALLLASGMMSCRDEMPEMQNPSSQFISNWDAAFESYWNGLNYNYMFWDIDSTDWDEVYAVYKPKFESIADEGFDDDEVNWQAFEWIKEMSSTLVDHHFLVEVKGLSDENGNSAYYSPGNEEVASREGYRENCVVSLRPNAINKLGSEGRFKGNGISFEDGTLASRYYISGLLDGEIAYLSFTSFVFSKDLSSESSNASALQPLLDDYYRLLDDYAALKGIIIDVRGNGGGLLDDMPLVLGKLISEPLEVFQTKVKNGPGRLDYTPLVPEYLQPVPCKRHFDLPVVILADMHSVSMAEMTTMAVLALPAGNGIFIGERTHGGNGIISEDFNEYYSGTFENTVLYVYTSSANLVDASGVSHEGKGITPTIELPLDVEKYRTDSIDNQLERAMEYIKEKK